LPSFKQTFWKIWYGYLSGRIGRAPVTFLNYGYWPQEGETVHLNPEDETNRPAIQLYQHVAGGSELTGKRMLEVSCGHGGGASFVMRYHHPAAYTGVDQNPKAIEYCRKAHSALGIDFRTGDAQALDFPNDHFDTVLNIEASHCYPRQDSFFRSAHRVLRPRGNLLFADFRPADEIPQLEQDATQAGFHIASRAIINDEVVRALQRTSRRQRALVHRLVPKLLHRAVETFAAVEGSSIYNSFVNRERIYLSLRLMKA